MTEHLRLEQLALDTVGAPRRRFLRDGLLAAGGLLLGAVAGAETGEAAVAARSPGQDRRILRFLLQLEYLQADFYEAALLRGRLRGELRELAEVVGAHEREHVALLEKRLGSSAGPRPSFDFGDATRDANHVARTARRLEETGVAAYIGQGANLTPNAVVAVGRITAVEARHAAWITDFLGQDPAPRVADEGKTDEQVLASIRRMGFVR